MDDAVAVAAEKPAARQPSRQGSLRLRALAPGSINVRAAAGSAETAGCHDAEVIPLLTPLHVAAAQSSSDQFQSSGGRHLATTTEVVAASGRCVAVEKTRLPAWWWHPAMPPFVSDHPPVLSSSVGFRFQNCV